MGWRASPAGPGWATRSGSVQPGRPQASAPSPSPPHPCPGSRQQRPGDLHDLQSEPFCYTGASSAAVLGTQTRGGAHGSPRGARVTRPAWQAALSTPHDTQPQLVAPPPSQEWQVGLRRGRRQVLPQPSGRCSPDRRLPGFQSLGARGAVRAPVCLRTQQRAGRQSAEFGVPSTTPLLEGSLRTVRVHTRLPAHQEASGPETQR